MALEHPSVMVRPGARPEFLRHDCAQVFEVRLLVEELAATHAEVAK